MAFDNILCEALQHSIEKFTVPSHVPGFNYALPRVIFRMFDFTDVPEECVLPGNHGMPGVLPGNRGIRIVGASSNINVALPSKCFRA